MMTEVLFWGCALLFLYAFAGYPAVLHLAGSVMPRRSVRQPHDSVPRVAVIVSVYNEVGVIHSKIQNFLALEYPRDRLELVVVSDGSTDGTDDVVRACSDERVRLLVQPRNMGKTVALNRAVAETDADILLFTDANSMLDSAAVRHMVAEFADPAVGLVSGTTMYTAAGGDGIYRRYEDMLKRKESRLFGIVGADGAIYAMRRELYVELDPALINDLLHPMQVVLAGRLPVQCGQAFCTEESPGAGGSEYRRQRRIMTQSWLVVLTCAGALARAGKWGFLWQVMSHKVLRWLVLPLMAVIFILNVPLAAASPLYGVTLLLQVLFYACAMAFRNADKGMLKLPFLFLLMHASGVTGLVRCLRGETVVRWAPRAQ